MSNKRVTLGIDAIPSMEEQERMMEELGYQQVGVKEEAAPEMVTDVNKLNKLALTVMLSIVLTIVLRSLPEEVQGFIRDSLNFLSIALSLVDL